MLPLNIVYCSTSIFPFIPGRMLMDEKTKRLLVFSSTSRSTSLQFVLLIISVFSSSSVGGVGCGCGGERWGRTTAFIGDGKGATGAAVDGGGGRVVVAPLVVRVPAPEVVVGKNKSLSALSLSTVSSFVLFSDSTCSRPGGGRNGLLVAACSWSWSLAGRARGRSAGKVEQVSEVAEVSIGVKPFAGSGGRLGGGNNSFLAEVSSCPRPGGGVSAATVLL
mmetsp:Transcript_24484/g.61587  ORF Transcript_24484/g.61587 Transcript_24484/m.61587 type:complete len:220 (+) Transcript_24484:792-1451(+)